MVTIRHAMGYQSKYLHLSRFAKGLRGGNRVAQKEVIGYVGSTGLATGAHLDFRLIRHGKPVNPLKQIFPPGPPIAAEYMDAYLERVKELAERMEPSSATRRAAHRVRTPTPIASRDGSGRGPFPRRSEALDSRGQ